MESRRAPSVVLFSGSDTLPGIDQPLRREGVRSVRIASWKAQPIDPDRWRARLSRPPVVDTVVITSRTAVTHGVRPWRAGLGRFPEGLEFWAVGPGTARALRRAGVKRVHRPASVGADRLIQALRGGRSRRIAYLRSDLAGPRLARALRRSGHSVVDVVVYRTVAPSALAATDRSAIVRAQLLVVTSPSGLTFLRDHLGPKDFSRVARTVPLVVLGERSRTTARRLAFRRVSVAPGSTPQRFTRFVLRELHHAPP